jgi:hypothetical protein
MPQVPTRTTFFIASAFGSTITTTAVSNAAEAVVTAAAHGLSNGDIVEVTSGWGRLNKRAYRVKSVTTDNFTLEGADTSSTTFYPAGSGTGSVREVTTWTQIIQVMDPQSSGGEPRNVTYKYVESDVEGIINDGFAATSYTMSLDADAIGTVGYSALRTLTESQADTVLRMLPPAGGLLLQPCKVALNETVQMQDGQINRVPVQFSGTNRAVRYAS